MCLLVGERMGRECGRGMNVLRLGLRFGLCMGGVRCTWVRWGGCLLCGAGRSLVAQRRGAARRDATRRGAARRAPTKIMFHIIESKRANKKAITKK